MKTVHNYIDVHRMTPVGMPVFSVISDDETVVAEIGPDCVESFDISDNNLNFTTNIFFYLNNPNWNKDKETYYTITYNQNFINPQAGETVLLERKYDKMYHNHYDVYGNKSNHNIVYTYYFVDEDLHTALKEE